jgi:hypothetical protein
MAGEPHRVINQTEVHCMTSNQNYKPIEILRAFEEGDDIPALEVGLSHQDNTWVTAQFIRQVDQVCEEFTKGADASYLRMIRFPSFTPSLLSRLKTLSAEVI